MLMDNVYKGQDKMKTALHTERVLLRSTSGDVIDSCRVLSSACCIDIRVEFPDCRTRHVVVSHIRPARSRTQLGSKTWRFWANWQ